VDRELRKERTPGEPGEQLIGSDGISQLTWTASRVRGTIYADEVHLWAWALESAGIDLSVHLEILDQQEWERMQRFHFAPDRVRYAVAHANLRRILGTYLNQPAERVRFYANRFGKPELTDNDPLSPLNFSLTHSRTIAVLAVANGRPVGVDVEDVRPIEPAVADTHFSAKECSHLSRLQGDAWLSGFYRCWTRKEAILKAEGIGLLRALDSFDVSLLADQPAELLETRERFSHPWKLHDLSPAQGTIGALATAQPGATLACFSFVSDSVS
jgi:4'-phosphopantetheinyl transferase